ncbi:MAG TPA: enoyl-CoA hydratase [Mycobacteriales bacterium]|jgi:enoyl-CoA hydratase|nr:enoyl-CoA hydratase [Mycobacteriales bacterium]
MSGGGVPDVNAEEEVAAPEATGTGDVLLVERSEGVATVTLNRPAARNALSSALLLALREALAALDADDEVGAVVLTGSDPAFCAGLDLKELGSTGGNLRLGGEPDGLPPGHPWAPMSTPLIGAVNGVAVTGGLELALHCDLLLASERAAFADTHARVGVMPGWGASVLLPAAIGTRLARQLSLTGDYLPAREALRAGLVSEVVPHEQLLPRAQELAATIAGNDRAAVRTLLATAHAVADQLHGPGLAVEAAASETWRQREFDPAKVEQRRAAVVARGRSQGTPS